MEIALGNDLIYFRDESVCFPDASPLSKVRECKDGTVTSCDSFIVSSFFVGGEYEFKNASERF